MHKTNAAGLLKQIVGLVARVSFSILNVYIHQQERLHR